MKDGLRRIAMQASPLRLNRSHTCDVRYRSRPLDLRRSLNDLGQHPIIRVAPANVPAFEDGRSTA